jgi:hypothetical protein
MAAVGDRAVDERRSSHGDVILRVGGRQPRGEPDGPHRAGSAVRAERATAEGFAKK